MCYASVAQGATHYMLIDSQDGANEKLRSVKPNTVVEFRASVNYDREKWDVPKDCLLKFSGGEIVVNQISGNNTAIEAPLTKVMSTKRVSGSWRVKTAYPEWFGGISDLTAQGTATDASDAIEMALSMSPSEICFSKGVYGISRPIVVQKTNICISGGSEIRALNEMEGEVILDGMKYQVKGMVVGDYMVVGEKEIFGLSTNKMIYGGGCINGDYKASVGIVLGKCLRTVIKDITIKNVSQYGFKASINGKSAGNCFMQNCVFKNEDSWNNDRSATHHPGAIAIYNNKSDCDYTNIEIVNFQTAVRHEAYNGNFTNLHAWLRDSYYWANSTVFDCFYPDITLSGCEADTMRRLLKCHSSGFFANITNCRSYNNTDVVGNKLATQYPPVVVDKNGFNDTQIYMSGGYYWFDTPYRVISNVSGKDLIQQYRVNGEKLVSNQ